MRHVSAVNRSGRRIQFHALKLLFWIPLTIPLVGCEAWFPLPPIDAEFERGLVVMYPGSFNTTSEMIGFYFGLKEGGVDQGIEVVQWAAFLDHMIDPEGAELRADARATQEAQRLAAYKEAQPGRPVTLLGYSGGCWFATLVAERMPEGVKLDRVILMSAAFDRKYDLTKALSNTRLGFVNFWSSGDLFTINIRDSFNLADGTKAEPAATFAFEMEDPRLVQIPHEYAWREYGYYGEHADYLFLVDWLAEYVAPWVATPE